MAEKRRSSSRFKTEPTAKRKFSEVFPESPKAPAKASKPQKKDGAAVSVAEAPEPSAPTLPTKITDSNSLPTLETPQDLALSDSEYQTIKESGVLAAAITRSRQRWSHGGVFEKFWSKAKTSKTMTDEEKKAARGPTMVKIGTAKLTVEPHVFTITLFTIKDPTGVPRAGQLPPGAPVMHYNGAQSRTASPSPSASGYHAHGQYQTPLPPVRAPSSHHNPAVPSAQSLPTPNPSAPRTPIHSQPHQAPRTSTVEQFAPARPTPAPATPAPDPVIRALAQRASTDMQLKSVMKIVATGMASPSQLEYFQKHIDELTKMVKAEQAAQKRSQIPPTPASRPAPQNQMPHNQTLRPSHNSAGGHLPPAHVVYQTPIPVPPANRPLQQSHPPTVAAPRPRQIPIVAPLHVVLQFSENSSDRFLFPKNTMLQYLPGSTSAFCSFIVVRHGKDAADPSNLDAATEYWVPISVHISSDAQTLMTLGRYVNSKEEVASHMESIMGRCKKAAEVNLALRLPREKASIKVEPT